MEKNDIHKLIDGYFNATLSEKEEFQLRQMLSETTEDSNDILEIKAVMGVFATNRKIEGKTLPVQKPQTAWGKMKYAAILVISIILDAIFDFDDPLENKISK